MTRLGVFTALVLALTAADARAQSPNAMASFKGYFTPFIGGIGGGDLTDSRLTFGASVAVHEQSGWGAELDLGHTTDAVAGRQVLDITSYTVNASWIGTATKQLHPFGTAGVGVMQINGCNSPCPVPARTYDLAVNVGGGAFLMLTDVIGLRGDVRYFFTADDHPDLLRPKNFGYVRATVGVTVSWATAP